MNTKEELCLHLIEYSPVWESNSDNLHFLSQLLENNNNPDIIILPEMFNTGFSMDAAKISEKMDGRTIQWMIDISIKNNIAICGSIAVEENNTYYNRFIFIAQGKIVSTYDKHHLFSYGEESNHYTPGNKKVTFTYLGWKICPIICFDLRFPVWNRNTEYYDLLINVANWPVNRIEVWDTLLKARSIENISYVCGVNRIGSDGMGLTYTGHSSIFSPIGKKVDLIKHKHYIYEQTLSLNELKKWRKKYRFLEEQDRFEFL